MTKIPYKFIAMSSVVLNGGSFSDVLKAGGKSLTSKDTWGNILASGITSTLTIGLTQYIDNKFNNIISNGNLNNNPFATTGQQFTSALAESTISNITSTAVQSAFNGDNFGESLKNQLLTSLVMAGANMGAKEIGGAYHNEEINKATQLTLHGLLGAGASILTGGDAMTGAVAGVIGEVAGEYAGEHYNIDNDALKEIGSFAGGIGAMFAGLADGQYGQELTDNIYNGQRIGKNAVENNFLYKKIIDTTLEYRDFKKTIAGNNIDYEYENNSENVTIPQEIEDIIYIGEKSGKILDKLPEVEVMNGNIEFGFSLEKGIYIGGNLCLLSISNKSGTINTNFGSIGAEIYTNKNDGVGIDGSVDIVKVEFTYNGVTYEASYGYGGGVSTKNPKPKFSLGPSFDDGLQF